MIEYNHIFSHQLRVGDLVKWRSIKTRPDPDRGIGLVIEVTVDEQSKLLTPVVLWQSGIAQHNWRNAGGWLTLVACAPKPGADENENQ